MYNGSKEQPKGELLPGRLACEHPECGSSDGVQIYRNTDPKTKRIYYVSKCFSCKRPNQLPDWLEDTDQAPARPALSFSRNVNTAYAGKHFPNHTTPNDTHDEILSEFKTYPCRALSDRGITKEVAEKYGVRVSLSPTDGESLLTHMYPYYKKGKLSGYKERIIEDKRMFSKADCSDTQLFGSHAFKPGGKVLYITEGECDALALYQILTSLSTATGYYDPAVVSLAHGAASAAKDISLDMDFVDSFDKVVLAFDQDDPGQAAVEDACKLLAGKVYIASFSEKDANDMLEKGKSDEMKWAVLKHAKQYMPDNIINYADCWDRYKNSKNQTCYSWPESWNSLNEKTYGIRLGELITITAGSGCGKTQFMREIKDHYYRTTDFKIADIALEEDLGDSIAGMMSLHLNKRITLPDVHVTEQEEKEAFEFYFKSGRWAGYDYFGGMDDSTLFSKIRFLAATGHQLIFLDHLSIIVSEYAAEGGERERIDTIMTKLAKMVKELNITIFLVVHLKKTERQPFEEGYAPSLDDLRGSGSLKQLSWIVIALARNQQHEDSFCANTSEIIVLKCRFTGRTGVADYLNFNDTTGRMIKVPKPDGYRPKKSNNFQPSLSKGGF